MELIAFAPFWRQHQQVCVGIGTDTGAPNSAVPISTATSNCSCREAGLLIPSACGGWGFLHITISYLAFCNFRYYLMRHFSPSAKGGRVHTLADRWVARRVGSDIQCVNLQFFEKKTGEVYAGAQSAPEQQWSCHAASTLPSGGITAGTTS